MISSILSFIQQLLAARLDSKAADFVRNAQQEIQANIVDKRFTVLISLASRYIPRSTLSPSDADLALAEQLLPGWSPASWSLLEAVRVSFILANKDVAAADFAERFSQWFTYADEGEQCAYYRAIPLLPEPQRFVWRAAEGCRTNMRSIFMSVACDSPFPVKHFDEVAWNQLVVKALFTETPLWRVYGLDNRLSDTLAVMVLDYMDERRSAGRSIPIDAWLCLGNYACWYSNCRSTHRRFATSLRSDTRTGARAKHSSPAEIERSNAGFATLGIYPASLDAAYRSICVPATFTDIRGLTARLTKNKTTTEQVRDDYEIFRPTHSHVQPYYR